MFRNGRSCGDLAWERSGQTLLRGMIKLKTVASKHRRLLCHPDQGKKKKNKPKTTAFFSIADSRILTFLETHLASSHQKPLPTAPGGLGPVQKELEEVAVKFVRLVNYNKMVFSPYYDAILSKILATS